jgi:tetratricopeptide (TPR) repeat protein
VNDLNQATRLHNAGVVCITEGKLEEAEKLLWQSLKLRTEVLGAMDPDVLATLRALCSVLTAQSKLSNAQEIGALMLSIKEQLVGKNHPDVAVEIDRLARLHDLQGNFEQAEDLYERAFELREQYLKDCHPDLAASLANLGAAYEANNQLGKAQECYRRLLASSERMHGTAHPKTIDVLERLLGVLTKERQPNGGSDLSKKWCEMAALYHGERRYSEAEIFYRRAIGKMEGSLSRGENPVGEPEEIARQWEEREPVRPSPERVLKLLKKATE